MQCGCTITRPACAEGITLFQALMHTKRTFAASPHEHNAFYAAEQAYRDHVADRRDGDLRVQTRAGEWSVEGRLRGNWIFQFASTKAAVLYSWLKEHGFWRYEQLDQGQPRDTLTGYYHYRVGSREAHRALLPTAAEQESPQAPRGEPLRAEMDMHTRLALHIMFLVTRFPRPLTLVDRLTVQRKAMNILASYGMEPVGVDAQRTVEMLIHEAVRVREQQERQSDTRPL